MIYFSDVDVVLKLARCGFLPNLTELLGVPQAATSIQYLASLKRRLSRPNKRLENAEYQEHLAAFCTAHEIINTSADLSRQEQLLQSGMDIGEAILFAEAERTGGIVVTGDKRAIKHYAKHSTAAQRANVKVVCWEQLLLRVHKVKGYEELKRGACEHLEDGLLSLAFSSGQATQEEHALEALCSYLNEVKSYAGDFLFSFADL